MTSEIWLRDILAYAIQAGVVVAAGVAVARLLRIRDARVALAWWRALLLVCLALPLCQPWNATPPPAVAEGRPVLMTSEIVAPVEAPPPPAFKLPSLERIAVVALAGGIAARAAWLAVGAFGLWRLRRRATPLDPLPATIRDAKAQVGAEASLCVSETVAGPITFGLLRPVVVFPATVASMPPHVQQAIACHELLHVRRRDWITGLIEEAVRTVLWFHPAIWWLIDRIQLTREQVVDEATIRLTESRERYVDALLVVARAKFSLALVPASPFLRRRLLKKRVAQILEVSTMTRRHVVMSLGISAAAIVFAAGLAVRAFPLQAQAQSVGVPGGVVAPVQIVKGAEHLLHGDLPEYPRRAIEQKVEGDMLMELVIDDRGEVADARVLSGPDELRRSALRSVLQWHYAAPVRSTTLQVALHFQVPAVLPEKLEMKFAYAHMAEGEGSKIERTMAELEKAMASPETTPEQKVEIKMKYADAQKLLDKIHHDGNPGKEWKEYVAEVSPEELHVKLEPKHRPFADGPVKLARIRTERVDEGIAVEIVKKAGFSVGSLIDAQAVERIQKVARDIDEHLEVGIGRDETGGLVLTIVSRD